MQKSISGHLNTVMHSVFPQTKVTLPTLPSVWITLWFVSTLLLLPSQLGRIMSGSSPRGIFLALTIWIVLLIPVGVINLRKLKVDLSILCLCFGFGLQALGLVIAFASYLNTPSSTHTINNQVTIIICFAIALAVIPLSTIRRNATTYAIFQIVMSVLALIVFVEVTILQTTPPATYIADNQGVFDNYYLAIEKVTARVNGIQRIQSFYEEPGTFAMFLLPAFCWFWIGKKNRILGGLLLVALVATLSFGAFIAIAILSLYVAYCFRNQRALKTGIRVVAILFTAFFVVSLIYLNLNSESEISVWLSKYLRSKINDGSEYSSGAQRVGEIDKLVTLLSIQPLGVEFEALSEDDAYAQQEAVTNISIGIFVSIARGGIIGLVGYSCIIAGILGMIIKVAIKRSLRQNRELVAYSAGIFGLLIMSFQRGDMFNFYSLMIILAGFVRYYAQVLFERPAKSTLS